MMNLARKWVANLSQISMQLSTCICIGENLHYYFFFLKNCIILIRVLLTCALRAQNKKQNVET